MIFFTSFSGIVILIIVLCVIVGITVLFDLMIGLIPYVIGVVVALILLFIVFAGLEKKYGSGIAVMWLLAICILIFMFILFGVHYNNNIHSVWYTVCDTKAQCADKEEYCDIPKDTMLVIKETTSKVEVYTMGGIPKTYTFMYEENGVEKEIMVQRSDVKYYGEIDMFGNVRKIDKE